MFPNSDTSETQSNETHDRTATRRKRVRRLSGLLLAAITLVVGITAAGQLSVAEAAGTVVAVDDAGADDEPGQKDLNWLSIDYGAPEATALTVKWGWDDTATSGANTRDAGSLFDTDGDGFANYSLYVTVETDGSYTTQLYSCAADTRTDRCAGPALVGTFASTATVALVADVDPFGVPGSADFDAAHVTGNTCRTNPACYTQDTVATADIRLADFGNPADAFLLNVCSYPSGEPNSDPSDCVFAANNGFLTIVKVANPDDGTSFPFNASEQSESNVSSWTIAGSGTQSLISYGPTTTLDLNEAVPAGWNLNSASCAIQTATPTATGTSTATGVDNLEIRSGLETICTFNDSLAQGTLKVIKTVVNDNGGTLGAGAFTVHVKSGGNDVAGSPAAGVAGSGGRDYTLAPGTYVVSEDTPPAGYAQTSIVCDGVATETVTVVANATKTCTITNNDVSAKLIVIKNVVNDEAGTKGPADFTMSVTGSSPSPASFPGAAAPGTQVSINPGSYSVSESVAAGYTPSFSTDCTGSIALGETKTCTVTNTDNDTPSSIVVTKTANPTSLPEPGGNATFSVTIQNTSVADWVDIHSLTDDVYGNLAGKGTCVMPQLIAPGASYQCSFMGAVSGNAGSSHTDVVTAAGQDDDGNNVSDSDDATVTITDVAAAIQVTKTADPTSLPEPGGNAGFDVEIKNLSSVDSVTITSLTDDVYGDLDGKGTCDVPQTLAPGASYSCEFTGAVSGNAGSTHTDIVTASGKDDDGNDVSDSDDATVTLTNVGSSIEVTKTANPTSLPEPGGNVSFSVDVKNTSTVDSVTITSMTDDIYGNLDGKGTCDVTQTLAPGATYSCSFTGAVSGNAGSSHTDVVTASGKDDDGNDVSDSDDAVVTLTNLPSSIAVTKTANPTSLPEPGGNATFSVTIQNTSAADSVTITSLTDDIYGNLDGKGTCDVPQTIAAGDSYSCSFTGAVGGNAGSTHTDVVTASGKDDDGNDVSDDDDATVTITDVAAAIQVTKTANPTSLPEPGGNATFSVEIKNLSVVDSVTITSLTDDIYGNLDGKGTCDVPQTLAEGASYSCEFTGTVSGNAGSSHTDVVTASGTDDDGKQVSGSDDAVVTLTNVPSSITVTKSASPTAIQEPGGTATFSVEVKNNSSVDSVTITSLTDDIYGNLDGKGTCDVPKTLAPGASYSCSFTGAVSGSGGSTHVDVVTASGTDDDGTPVTGSDDASVSITSAPSPPPPPATPPVIAAAATIDLSIVKVDRPDPVFVGGRLTYTLTVRNLGPDTATNVQVADSLPVATDFVSVTTSQGTCTGGRVIRCSLGTMPSGARATITIVVRPTEPGALINTATVVGEQSEPNTANNRSSAPTLVKGPFQPPVASCPVLTVQPRSLSVGKRGIVKVLVTDKGRGVRGVRILVKGPGLYKAATTNGRGRVAISVQPSRTGIVEISMTNQPNRCSTRRIGVVGIFQPPPVTG